MDIPRLAIKTLLLALQKDGRSRLGSGTPNHADIHFEYHYSVSIEGLISYVETRGPEILLVNLPLIGKEVDKGLSSSFDWRSLDKHKVNFKWLKTLLRDVFDYDGRPYDDVTAEQIFFLRQLLYFFKKYNIDCPKVRTKEAVDDFVKIDQNLRDPSGPWDNDHWVPARFRFSGDPQCEDSHPRAERIWSTVDRVFGSIVPLCEVDIPHIRPKHGPGAVADIRTGNDKYAFPYWPSKLESVFSFALFGQHREDLHVSDTNYWPSEVEPPARLIAVPKTYSGPRLIASEPTAHQFLQQGLMEWFRSTLSPLLRNTIDFTSQEKSREAALLGSLHGDLATVDLSSASDRLSCWAVERAFGANQSLLRCLHAVRTRTIIDGTGSHEGLHLKMKKFAAQGSAVTFPVQTIIYAGLAIASTLISKNLNPTRRNIRVVAGKIRVFGDDIILPKEAVPMLTLMLNTLQLKVNAHKTHTSGSFRESCGMDAFKGDDVTPCYIHNLVWNTSPEDISSWMDVCNNAFIKGLWNVSITLEQMIPSNIRRKSVTTRTYGDGLRLFSFCKGFLTQAKCRYSQHLHREELRLFAIRSQVKRRSRQSYNDFYQWLVEAPDPQSKWVHGYHYKKTSRICEVWAPIYVD